MKIYRPLWEDGAFLAPQQFQQQARWDAHVADTVARMALAHPWGVLCAEFDEGALALSRLNATRLCVRFADGTLVDTDLADTLPPVCDLSAAGSDAVEVLLCLPLLSANGGNLDDGQDSARPRRWQSERVSPPDLHPKEEAQWFTVTPELPGVRVRQNGHVALSVTDWQWESGSRASRLYDTLWLDSILALMAHHLTRPLSARQGELPQLNLCAAGICLAPIAATEDNLWQQLIAGITTLCPKPVFAPDLLPLPEVLLPYLPRRHGISRRMQNMRLAGGISFVFLALAMLASFINNQRLVRSVGDHLAVYHRLSGTPPEPKQQAQQRLQADSRLLDDWLRRGEPLRYGLGLDQGMRLIPPVEAAINSWTPPPPPRPVIKKIVQGPQTVRLDSMSLFDTGKWALKPASTKLLVNSLVGIKAKPGWLIVVAGHTDSTGDDQSNQVLSLKRAESVRDWMRDTGDVPESCFAVQGYGESRPVATNDTAEGRTLNRRVEISLVPQANACQLPGNTPASSQDDGADNNLTE